MPSIGVTIVHPEPGDRKHIASVLDREHDIDVLGAACDGREALDLVEQLDPDVVVMELRLPRLDGVRATRILTTEREPPPAVLALAGAPTRDSQSTRSAPARRASARRTAHRSPSRRQFAASRQAARSSSAPSSASSPIASR